MNSKSLIPRPFPDVWKILIPLLIAGVGGFVGFYTQGVKTEERVEHIQEANNAAAQDRAQLHRDLDNVESVVIELRADVRNANAQAASREARTTKAIEGLTKAVNMRRR